ncbi:MAG: restriction endonuclease subunit S [Actinobacteria bacterium]|nr:restriction endonuclease subunit S [Actinomycetota bacterium]MBI3688303.1 restriction endonuclease subunit S [Actinomycetota bacterium]
MSEWKTYSVADIAAPGKNSLATGPFGSAIGSRFFRESGIPVIRGSNLSVEVGSRLVEDDFVFVEESKAAEFSRSIVAKGDLIFTCWGTIGQVGLVDDNAHYERYLISNKQMKLTPNLDIADPVFCYYLFTSPVFVAQVNNVSIGSSVPGFNLSQLRKLPISLPSLTEQRAIVGLLGALDDKIAVNGRISITAENLARTLVGAVSKTKRVSLADLVDQRRGQVVPDVLDVPVVAHYSLPAFDSSHLPEIVDPGLVKSGKFLVSNPSVLISKLNPATPRVWNVHPTPLLPSIASTEFLVLEPAPGFTTHEIWAVCVQEEFLVELSSKVAGTSNSHQRVPPADVLSAKVVDPRTMGGVCRHQISVLCQAASHARIESRELSHLRDTLLPKLMSGEIRVRDAEKVVEEVT